MHPHVVHFPPFEHKCSHGDGTPRSDIGIPISLGKNVVSGKAHEKESTTFNQRHASELFLNKNSKNLETVKEFVREHTRTTSHGVEERNVELGKQCWLNQLGGLHVLGE